MSESPFHGIFSAFTAGQEEKSAGTPKDAAKEPQPKQQSVPVQTVKGGSGQIAVDIYEHEDYFIVRAPIAGVKMSDLDIEVEGKSLTIRGKRSESDEITEENFFLKECFWGEFHRTISLPVVIDAKKVKATFSKDSVLKVYVPKGEEKVKIVRVGEN